MLPPDRELHGMPLIGAIGAEDRIIVNRQHHLQTWLRAFPGLDGVLAPSCSFFPEDLEGGEVFVSGSVAERIDNFERFGAGKVFSYHLSVEGHHINARQVLAHPQPEWLVPETMLGLVLVLSGDELDRLRSGEDLPLPELPVLRRLHPVYRRIRAVVCGDRVCDGATLLSARVGDVRLRAVAGREPVHRAGVADMVLVHGRIGWLPVTLLEELLPAGEGIAPVPSLVRSAAAVPPAAPPPHAEPAPARPAEPAAEPLPEGPPAAAAHMPTPPRQAGVRRPPAPPYPPALLPERVYVLMDGQNVLDARPSHVSGVEFSRMIREVVGDRTLGGVRLHLGIYPEGLSDPALAASRDWLIRLADRLSYEGLGSIQLHSLERKEDLWVQKGVDVALAVEALELAYRDAFDTLVLISGDQDFVPALESLHRLGKRVEVVSWQGALSYKMRLLADRVVVLDQYPAWHRLRAEEQVVPPEPAVAAPAPPRAPEPAPVRPSEPVPAIAAAVPSRPAGTEAPPPSPAPPPPAAPPLPRIDPAVEEARRDLYAAYERALGKVGAGPEGGVFHSELALALRHEMGVRQLNLPSYGFDKLKDLTDHLERLGRVTTYQSAQKALMVRLADAPAAEESEPIIRNLAAAAAAVLADRPEGLTLDGLARRLRATSGEAWAEGLRLHGRSQVALLRKIEQTGTLRLLASGNSWRVVLAEAWSPAAAAAGMG